MRGSRANSNQSTQFQKSRTTIIDCLRPKAGNKSETIAESDALQHKTGSSCCSAVLGRDRDDASDGQDLKDGSDEGLAV